MLHRLVFFLAVFTAIASADWTEDRAEALSLAKEQKRDLLIAFTGSDWDAWSGKLLQECIDTEEFKKTAPEHFVLLQVDFPLRIEVEAEEKEKREAFKKRYGVKGYPTLVLADSEGVPYCSIGYQIGDAEKMLERLKRLKSYRIRRDSLKKEIEGLDGMPKAEVIIKLLKRTQPEHRPFHQDLLDELRAIDPDDHLGYFQGIKLLPAWRKETEDIKAAFQKKKFDEVIVKVDAFIEEYKPTGRLLQSALTPKLYAYGNQDNLVKAQQVADQIKAIDPEGPASRQVEQLMDQLKKIVAQKALDIPQSIARPEEKKEAPKEAGNAE